MSDRERGRPARGLAEGGGDATLPADDATIAIPGGSGNVPRPDTLLSQLRQTDSGTAFELPALPADAYEIGPEVARGGMGRVVRAIDHRLGRVVALKLLLGQGPDLRARFAREAQITAGLQHPSIVPIYEAGTWSDGNLAYAMKLVSGESLEAAITACTSLEERMALLPRFIDVVDAVAYAHSERVVHRDIKPSNIILGEFGETILIDWGVAKSLDVEEEAAALEALLPVDSDASRLTALGAVVGTPVYMPPEQAAGDTIDDRADVYSLGAVLYQLLAGRLPYTGANPLDVLRKVALTPPAPLESIDPHIPPELAAVVARAMARERGDRYSAAELAAELRRYTTGKLVAAYHYSARERFVRWVRRHRAPVVVAAAALAVLVAVGTWSTVRIIRERDRAQSSDRRRRALVADQYAEQGRILLLGGDRLRAIAYFLAASEEGARGSALDYLLARAATSLAQKRLELIGHRGPVPFITFDASGARVFTVSDDGTARVWDRTTGTQLHMVTGPPLEVLGGELAPGGEEILTFSKSGTAHVWSFAPGDPEPIVVGERVTCARYSRDGKQVVTGGPDGRVRVFDRASQRTLADFTAHKGLVRDVWLDARGAQLWSAGEDGVVAVWTPHGGALRHWKLERGAALGITTSPDGGRIATILRDGAVAVWSGSFESPPDILELGEPVSAGVRWSRLLPVFIAGGTRLAVPVNRSVQIIDLVARRRLHSLTGHQGEVTWVTTSPDDAHIATASSDGGVRLWDPVDGRLESILPTVDHVQMVAFAPRGELVATASYSGAAVWLPAPDPPIRRLVGHAGSIYSARFRPDGKRLVTGSGDGTARIWDVASGRELARLAIGAPVTGAVYDPAGHRLVIADDGGVATVWDADTNLKLTTLERRKKALMAAEFSPDGRIIAVAGDDGEVRLWNATSFGTIATLSHPAAVNALAFDKTGERIVTVTQDGGARIWEWRKRQVLVTIPLDGPGLAADFSPDGTRIIVSARQTARIHDAISGRLRARLDAHQREVGAVRLTADGLAVTGGYDQSTKIWDAETGRVLASHEGHGQWIMGVDLDPSGRLAATCDLDGVVILWQLPRETRSPAQVVKELGSRLEFSVRDGLLVSRSKH